jgi:hypothetical protein
VWKFILAVAQNHGEHAAIGLALLGWVNSWLKQAKGRYVEIKRSDLTVRAPNARELKKALAAMQDYERLNIDVHGSSPKPRKKEAVVKSRRKSK